jgi:hypothetical protein
MDAEAEKGVCLPCDKECHGCNGPTVLECTDCLNFKIFTKDLNEEQLTNYSAIYGVTANDTVSANKFSRGEIKRILNFIKVKNVRASGLRILKTFLR